MIRTLAALLFVLVLTACTTQSGTQLPEAEFFVNAGQQFGLRVGETACDRFALQNYRRRLVRIEDAETSLNGAR